MNVFLNILVIIITGGFLIYYVYSFILNLIRAKKNLKEFQNDPDYIEGTVIQSVFQKGRNYVVVQYVSKKNQAKFNETFDLQAIKKSKEELKTLQKGENIYIEKYKVGDNVRIKYGKTKIGQKVTNFPIFIDGEKERIDKAPIVMDIAIVGAGLYILIYSLVSIIAKDATGVNGLMANGRPFIENTRNFSACMKDSVPCFTGFYLIIEAFFYFVFFQYVLDRIKGLNTDQKNQYLKLCGTKGLAEVKTYKFTKQKSQDGYKEAEIKIEFFTNNGEKINTTIYSFLYSKTEEQYITILYDENNPTSVVYMRENDK